MEEYLRESRVECPISKGNLDGKSKNSYIVGRIIYAFKVKEIGMEYFGQTIKLQVHLFYLLRHCWLMHIWLRSLFSNSDCNSGLLQKSAMKSNKTFQVRISAFRLSNFLKCTKNINSFNLKHFLGSLSQYMAKNIFGSYKGPDHLCNFIKYSINYIKWVVNFAQYSEKKSLSHFNTFFTGGRNSSHRDS